MPGKSFDDIVVPFTCDPFEAVGDNSEFSISASVSCGRMNMSSCDVRCYNPRRQAGLRASTSPTEWWGTCDAHPAGHRLTRSLQMTERRQHGCHTDEQIATSPATGQIAWPTLGLWERAPILARR